MNTRPAAADQSFDDIVEVYDRFSEIINSGLVEWLREELPGGRSAIDLGCGGGGLTVALADRYEEVVAVDLSEEMVRFANRCRPRANVRYVAGDLREVSPETHGRHDLVFTAYTLHHVPDLGAALERLGRLVLPGGSLLVVDIVGRRQGLSRGWYVRQRWRTLLGDLLLFRRPVAEAIELYRISQDPRWLKHVMSDRPVSAEEFEEAARAALPSVDVLDLGRARMLRWVAGPAS